MIKICESAIVCVKPDGTRSLFDFERMRKLICEACGICGIPDKRIGDDIAFSIEFALRTLAEQGHEFTEREIDCHIVRILENAGLLALAKEYIRLAEAEIFISVNTEEIFRIIVAGLSIPEDKALILADKTIRSLFRMSLSRATPALVLELCRFLMMAEEFHEVSLIKKEDFLSARSDYPWFISQEDIITALSRETLSFISSGALTVLPVSKLFPSFKIELNLNKFVKLRGLETPFTEMLLGLELPRLSAPIYEIDSVVRNLYEARKAQIIPSIMSNCSHLPAYLKFTGLDIFFSSCMALEFKEGIKILGALFEDSVSLPNGMSLPELKYFNK